MFREKLYKETKWLIDSLKELRNFCIETTDEKLNKTFENIKQIVAETIDKILKDIEKEGK